MGNFLFAIASKVATAVVLFAALTVPLEAQSLAAQSSEAASGKLAFEVASIKPNHSVDTNVRFGLPPGRFTATSVTVKLLIEWAYNGTQSGIALNDDQIVGGPSWINSDRYDIDAKVEDSLTEDEKKVPLDRWADEVRLMAQSLLADRFKLKVSRGTRDLPIYALVIAKNGPKLVESTVPPLGSLGALPPPGSAPPKGPMFNVGRGKITAVGMSVGVLADFLPRAGPELGGREVIDQTGLKGNYDFTLLWTPENQPSKAIQASDNAVPPDSSGPSIFTAIQEQVGLKLESQTGPVNVLVIDHIEQPSEN